MKSQDELQAIIDAQAATIARLRFLVQSAYYEGWEDAQDACSANVLFTSNSLDDWEISTSRAALTGAA